MSKKLSKISLAVSVIAMCISIVFAVLSYRNTERARELLSGSEDTRTSLPEVKAALAVEDSEEAFKRMRTIPWADTALVQPLEDNPFVRAVVEDDEYTYFAFHDGIDLPVVYVVSKNGYDQLINSIYLEELNVIAAKEIAEEWTVRLGDKYTNIKRDKESKKLVLRKSNRDAWKEIAVKARPVNFKSELIEGSDSSLIPIDVVCDDYWTYFRYPSDSLSISSSPMIFRGKEASDKNAVNTRWYNREIIVAEGVCDVWTISREDSVVSVRQQ